MALIPGTRLGPYDVTAQIGAGGMGEVYKARDTKLNRDVALKVLPDSFANDPDRLARFTREAQTLASLNHPSSAHIQVRLTPMSPRHQPSPLPPTFANAAAAGDDDRRRRAARHGGVYEPRAGEGARGGQAE